MGKTNDEMNQADLATAIMLLAEKLGASQGQVGETLEALRANQAPREIKEGDAEYTERLKAEGFYDEFEHPVIQNGYDAQARGLTAEVRHRAANLRPGRYIKNRVTIEVDNKGSVHIKYPNKDNDRIINREHWSSFPDLVNQVWDEMHVKVPA